MGQETFKYADELANICALGTACPPPDAAQRSTKAYRWVKQSISADCFSPVAKRNPKRLLNEDDPHRRCSCWGLSLHGNLKASVAAFQKLEVSVPNARKIFGGWVAEGDVLPNHGKCTSPDRYAHFDLHEYANSSVRQAFSVLQSIPVQP